MVKSYSDAGYFGRTLRAIEVLIDQEKVRAGVGSTASALLERKSNLLRMREEIPQTDAELGGARRRCLLRLRRC